ncbi:7731_t:CDS:2 [Gigaspora margarita]|uniref:7731_t:CDS:1 n=1 Tax=Gigaspora margarita TaxID=4874 RepID=A0ABN7UWE9_GIGMA|nr:7731_t:CDS:2 [Gigaspora margarita]
MQIAHMQLSNLNAAIIIFLSFLTDNSNSTTNLVAEFDKTKKLLELAHLKLYDQIE